MAIDYGAAEESTIHHYSALAPFADELFGDAYDVINQRIRSWIVANKHDGSRVLDFGCGTVLQ